MTGLDILARPSPNFDDRGSLPIDMLVLHYTGMKTAAAALARLTDAAAKVSAHYLIEETGEVFRLVDEARRAWHAGVASWRGDDNINARSIGIELVNPGHEFGYRNFPEAQMVALEALAREILARHPIPARNVVGHADVAPARRQDPGELFDWPRLAGAGIGLWPVPEGAPAEALTELLAVYGYEVAADGVVTAFQRHFRPARVDGVADDECAGLAAGLLKAVEAAAE